MENISKLVSLSLAYISKSETRTLLVSKHYAYIREHGTKSDVQKAKDLMQAIK